MACAAISPCLRWVAFGSDSSNKNLLFLREKQQSLDEGMNQSNSLSTEMEQFVDEIGSQSMCAIEFTNTLILPSSSPSLLCFAVELFSGFASVWDLSRDAPTLIGKVCLHLSYVSRLFSSCCGSFLSCGSSCITIGEVCVLTLSDFFIGNREFYKFARFFWRMKRNWFLFSIMDLDSLVSLNLFRGRVEAILLPLALAWFSYGIFAILVLFFLFRLILLNQSLCLFPFGQRVVFFHWRCCFHVECGQGNPRDAIRRKSSSWFNFSFSIGGGVHGNCWNGRWELLCD